MTTHELVHLLRHAYNGDPWHGPPLKTVVTGVSAETATQRPLPGRHSIWEIALHVTGWTREVEHRLGGATPGQPQEGDWPPQPEPATPAAWTQALQALEAAHESVTAAVARFPDARWDEMVGDLRDPAEGTGVTCGTMIVGLATHYAYHAGQIAMLKPR